MFLSFRCSTFRPHPGVPRPCAKGVGLVASSAEMNAFFRFVCEFIITSAVTKPILLIDSYYYIVVSCVLFAANGECIDEESSSIAVLKGEDLELMCTSLIPGSDWYGYDAEDIQCKEGSYIKKCTVEGIGTQFTIESFEMELVLANGTCVKKCTFQINIVPGLLIVVKMFLYNNILDL